MIGEYQKTLPSHRTYEDTNHICSETSAEEPSERATMSVRFRKVMNSVNESMTRFCNLLQIPYESGKTME